MKPAANLEPLLSEPVRRVLFVLNTNHIGRKATHIEICAKTLIGIDLAIRLFRTYGHRVPQDYELLPAAKERRISLLKRWAEIAGDL